MAFKKTSPATSSTSSTEQTLDKTENFLRIWVQRLRPYLGYVLVFIAAYAVYLNTLGNTYTFDDGGMILSNARIRQLTHPGDIFGTSYWNSPDKGSEYRPLTVLSYALNYALNHVLYGPGGELEHPSSFHRVNILLHALASVLAAWVVMSLFKRRLLAIATGLLFALHPIHTEAVASIVGRAELLAAIGFLIGLGAWSKIREAGSPKAAAGWMVVLAVAFAFGVFSKENAITLTGVVLLEAVVWARLQKLQHQDAYARKELIRQAGALGVLALICVLYLWARVSVLGGLARADMASYGYMDNQAFGAIASDRIFTAIRTQGEYIFTLFWPQTLIADYSYNAYPLSHSFMETNVLAGAVILFGLGLACVIGFLEGPVVAFAAGFYLLTMSLTSNIPFPIGTIKAERLLYLPSFGFCLGLALVFERLWYRFRLREIQAILFVLFLFVCGTYFSRTYDRNQVWKDDLALFSDTVKSAPKNLKAHINLANSLAGMGKFDEALWHAHYAIDNIQPTSGFALTDIGAFSGRKASQLLDVADDLEKKGQKNDAETDRREAERLNQVAEQYFKKAISANPEFVPAFQNLGVFLCTLGRYAEGLESLEKARMLSPKDIQSLQQLDYWYWWAAGDPKYREERLKKSIGYAKEILALMPGDITAKLRVGTCSFELGNYQESVFNMENAISESGGNVDSDTYSILGGAYYHLNDLKKAEAAFRMALKRNPQNREAAKALALAIEAKKTGVRRGLGLKTGASSAPAAAK